MAKEIDAAVAVAPLVVVPADQLEKSFIEADSGAGIKNTGGLAVNEVGGDNFVRGVFQDAFEISFRGLFHGLANFLVRGVFGRANGEVDHADRRGGNAEGHAGQFSLNFGADEADRFGGTGG